MPLKIRAASSTEKPSVAPRSAVSTGKPATQNQKKNAKPAASTKAPKKSRRHTAAFSALKSRQQAIGRAKQQIWRHLEEINGAIIKLAESGSYLAARALFDFAGVYNLPPLEDETAPATSPVDETAAPQPVNRVEAFLQSLGLDPLSDEEPEPDVAA